MHFANGIPERVELRTMMTFGFPFVAIRYCEMRTLTGKRPTIVKGPYSLYVVLFNETEEKGKVDITAVKIV